MADDKERAEIKRQLTELTELRTPDSKVLEANKNNPTVAEISISENVFPKNTKQHLNQVRNTQIDPFGNDSCLPQVSYSDSQVSMDETDVCLGPIDLCKPSEDDTSNCEVSVETITPILEVQNDGDIHSYNNQTENTMESQQRTDNVVR